MTIIPEKLNVGDIVGVVSPSRSLSIISSETRQFADFNLNKIGLTPFFAQNVEDQERYTVKSIERRISDIHEMFQNTEVKGILTAIGGYQCKHLLRYLNWDIIRKNPKIFCGYSDTTILANAIYVKTGLMTYLGPHYSTFGQKRGVEYTSNNFLKCCFENKNFQIEPSNKWSDDEWWVDQDNREFITNLGPVVVNEGNTSGIAIGGNLGALLSLAATEFSPSLKNTVVFAEVTDIYDLSRFDAKLQSLILQRDFTSVKALLIGRFQKKSKIYIEDLKKVINSKEELKRIPVVINLDFGHTQPLFTFPIGGKVDIEATSKKFILKIVNH